MPLGADRLAHGAAACLLLSLVAFGVCAGGAARAAATAPQALYVDSQSLGGRCDDARPPADVSPATPWCSLSRAFAAAPAGSTVYVRAGDYPTVSLARYRPAADVTFHGFGDEWPVVHGVVIGRRGVRSSGNFALVHLKLTNPGVQLVNVRRVYIATNELALTPVPPTNCSPAAASCTVNTPVGVSLDMPASDITVADNDMHDGASGVWLHNGNAPTRPGRPLPTTYQHIAVSDNVFADMGDVVLGIQNYEDMKVTGNIFINDHARPDVDPYCHCDAVHVIGGGDRLLLDGNAAYGGRGFLLQPGPPWGNCAPTCQRLTNVTIRNNLLLGPDFSLRVISSPGIRILDNTIWGAQERADLGLMFFGDPPATSAAVLAGNVIRDFEVDAGVGFGYEDYNAIATRATGPGLEAPLGPHDILTRSPFLAPMALSWP